MAGESMVSKFLPGKVVKWGQFKGVVVDNNKLPGDICIEWENGLKCSYDEDFLIENGVEPEITLEDLL